MHIYAPTPWQWENLIHLYHQWNKKTLYLKETIDQMDLTDVFRIFHPATVQYTFFSADHGTFSKIDHILRRKASLN
jgi:exonuclease III